MSPGLTSLRDGLQYSSVRGNKPLPSQVAYGRGVLSQQETPELRQRANLFFSFSFFPAEGDVFPLLSHIRLRMTACFPLLGMAPAYSQYPGTVTDGTPVAMMNYSITQIWQWTETD